MNSMISAACLVGLISVCTAHMCLINPHQRGSMMDLNKPAAKDCVLLAGPCGGRPAMAPMTMWTAGGMFSVTFQKNLDHWVMATPGYFSVSMMAKGMSHELMRVKDMGEPSLHLYTASGMLPSMIMAGSYVLQVTYVTMNPSAPAMFYQCADVMVK